MEFETILYGKKGHVVTIILNRPQVLNAINRVMHTELQRAWVDFRDDDDLYVAILTGAGDRAFCAGSDRKEMERGALAPLSHGGHRLSKLSNRDEGIRVVSARHNLCWKPVITAVNGMCVGGALHFIADTDICICSENATFFDTHPDIPLAAIWEPIQLVRKIPYEIVLRMMLLGRHERLSAQRAYEIGLVSEVVPLPELMPRAMQIAEVILQNDIRCLMATIEATYKSLELGMLGGVRQGLLIRDLANRNESNLDPQLGA